MKRLIVGAASLLFAVTVQVTAQTPRGSKGDESVAARLQRFEDKEEIQKLLLDYGRHLDSRDFAAYSALFAKDGEWVGGFGSVSGPANIKTFMEKAMGTQPNVAKNTTCSRIS